MASPADLSSRSTLSINIPGPQQIVGRLAAQIAPIIRGKHKPTFCPNDDCGDVVVVVNANAVEFTGEKWQKKVRPRGKGNERLLLLYVSYGCPSICVVGDFRSVLEKLKITHESQR